MAEARYSALLSKRTISVAVWTSKRCEQFPHERRGPGCGKGVRCQLCGRDRDADPKPANSRDLRLDGPGPPELTGTFNGKLFTGDSFNKRGVKFQLSGEFAACDKPVDGQRHDVFG